MTRSPASARSLALPLLLLLVLLALLAVPARADTVILKSGKKLKNVVVSKQDDLVVVINPFNSRSPDMHWEIPSKNRIPRDQVEEVVISDPPLHELRLRDAQGALGAEERLELAAIAGKLKMKKERERQLLLALCADPENIDALKAVGAGKWKTWSRSQPLADPSLAELEREYVQLKNPAALKAQLDMLKDKKSVRALAYLERARRSAEQPTGRRDKVPLTLRSQDAPGATYCIYVPTKYDPLTPTPLVVALHGGGGGGSADVITGSGESAMNFYFDIAEKWGWIVVAPTAVAAPWGAKKNEAWLNALLDEMHLLYNVDETRVYLTGHSMGGFGTWYWGAQMSDVWAACSPCAGGGSVSGELGTGVPIYIYHGADDAVVGPGRDRSCAKSLVGDKKKDFIYTELDGVGHGFPRWVREDIFKFFAARRKDNGKRRANWPVSSFDRKVGKDEKKTFGDPSVPPAADGEGDANVKELVKALRAGGGGGAAAVEELGKLKDAKTVKSVARLLKLKDATTDTRVLAARTLGKHTGGDDFRVLEAVATALGETGLEDAAPPLVKTLARIGEKFDEQLQGGGMVWRQYEVRTGSLTVACDACAGVNNPDVILPALEKEVAKRVFLRAAPLEMLYIDNRFVRIPPASRLALAKAMAGAARAQGGGDEFLAAVGAAWRSREPQIEKSIGAALGD